MIEIDQERSIPELELRFAQSRSSGPGRSSGRRADGLPREAGCPVRAPVAPAFPLPYPKRGSRETASPDLLSLLMFQPDYVSRLIEIGEADAEARVDDIGALLDS